MMWSRIWHRRSMGEKNAKNDVRQNWSAPKRSGWPFPARACVQKEAQEEKHDKSPLDERVSMTCEKIGGTRESRPYCADSNGQFVDCVHHRGLDSMWRTRVVHGHAPKASRWGHQNVLSTHCRHPDGNIGPLLPQVYAARSRQRQLHPSGIHPSVASSSDLSMPGQCRNALPDKHRCTSSLKPQPLQHQPTVLSRVRACRGGSLPGTEGYRQARHPGPHLHERAMRRHPKCRRPQRRNPIRLVEYARCTGGWRSMVGVLYSTSTAAVVSEHTSISSVETPGRQLWKGPRSTSPHPTTPPPHIGRGGDGSDRGRDLRQGSRWCEGHHTPGAAPGLWDGGWRQGTGRPVPRNHHQERVWRSCPSGGNHLLLWRWGYQ